MLLSIIKLKITMYLPVFKYKYYKRKTQVSDSTAPSRYFSGKTMKEVWKGELHHRRISTYEV